MRKLILVALRAAVASASASAGTRLDRLPEFQYTPTISGQAKLAAAEWNAMAGFSKGS